jgi:hypothetical protein
VALGLVALGSGCAGEARALRARSPDKRHLAELVTLASGAQRVVHDGVARGAWRGVGALAWSPTSERVAYVASDVTPLGPRQWVVVGARSFGPFEGVGALAWSGDGREVAFAVERGARWAVARVTGHGLTLGPEHDGLVPGSLRFGPCRGRALLTWLALEGGGQRLAVMPLGGPTTLGAAFTELGGVTFDDEGEHVVARGRRGETWHVVLDGASLATSERAPRLALGHRGLAFTTSAGRVVTVHRRSLAAPREVLQSVTGLDEVEALVMPSFSFVARRGGARVAYVRGVLERALVDAVPETLVESRAGRVVVAGRARGGGLGLELFEDGRALARGLDALGVPTFSPDGARLGVLASSARGVSLLVEPSLAEPGPRALAERPVVGEPSSLVLTRERWAYLARRGERTVAVHDRGESAHDLVLEGSLVLVRDEGPLGLVAARSSDRAFYVVLEGRAPLAIDKRELFEDLLDTTGEAPGVGAARWVHAAAREGQGSGGGERSFASPFRPLEPP